MASSSGERKMLSSSGERKMLLLRSSDQEEFQVEESVAGLSSTIKQMMDNGRAGDPIPLPNVDGKTLAKVLVYCNKHGSAEGERMAEQDLKEWDEDFVNVDLDTLYDLIVAANFLEIKGLLDLTCKTVADMIKGKTSEQIREIFDIENDFTPEEEEEIREDNQ